MTALDWWWVIAIILAIPVVAIFIYGVAGYRRDPKPSDDILAGIWIIGGILLIFWLILGVGRWVIITMAHADCKNYAQNTGREVEFVTYSFGGYECYVVTPDGIYPKSQLRESE